MNNESTTPLEPDDRRLLVIRGLLTKAEASEFPEEAEAFFAKASELIARYAIDEAMIWAAQDTSVRSVPQEIQLVVEAPYVSQKGVLIGAVAHAHGCQTVAMASTDHAGKAIRVISVVGFASDLKWVETLVTSLLLQLGRALLHGQPAGLTASRSAAWRRSFIIGFSEEVSERLTADRVSVANDESSTALVLIDREAQVNSELRRRYPRVRTTWVSSGSSSHGRDAGRAAGRDAALTKDSLGGRRSLPRG